LDLVWVVMVDGPTNVQPAYDYSQVLADDPSVADLVEAEQDYVRLVGPEADPERSIRWLPPYLDPFKGIWMTSVVAPLYEGDSFVGSVGADVLLPTVSEAVRSADPGHRGYAVLLAGDGRLVATPEQGMDALAWEPTYRSALHRTLLPIDEQHWPEDEVAALNGTSLADHPDPGVRELVAAMERGERGTRRMSLAATPVFVSISPVGATGWSMAVVQPVAQALAGAEAVRASIQARSSIVRAQFGFLTLVVLAIGIGAGVVLNGLAIRPLTEFTRRVAELRWNRLDFASTEAGRDDEVGQLHRKFGELVSLIRTARDQLTDRSEELSETNDLLRASNTRLDQENHERLKAERALSDEKELLAVTLRSIGEAVLVTSAQGTVLLVNPAAEALTGWSEADALGMPIDQVLRLEAAAEGGPALHPIAQALEQGEAVILTEPVLLRTPDGSLRSVSDSAAPLRAPDGSVMGGVVVLRDVTERERLRTEMAQVERLRTVQVLAAGIAHDFNNLLAAVQSNTSLARHAAGEHSPVGELLHKAEQAVGRAHDLTLQLLTFSTGGEPIRELLAPGPIVSDAAGFGLRGATVALRVDEESGLLAIRADRGQLSQVVQNLVLNASQAMTRGGTVSVHLANRSLAEGEHGLPAGPYLELRVHDEGPGIPADRLPHIFEPFFTTKDEGTGLGLAVCHSIVTRHGGHMAVETSRGTGTTFVVLLPATLEALPSLAHERPGLPYGTGRLLVMDDDPALREAATQVLEVLGYEVVAAEDGQEAIDMVRLARLHGQPFDLVLLDLTVRGGMGGLEALAGIHALEPELPALVSSGYSTAPVTADPMAYGFVGAVPKPFGLHSMGEAVALALARVREQRSPEVPPNA